MDSQERGCDPDLLASLIGRDDRLRRQAVRTILALEQERQYSVALLGVVDRLHDGQRRSAGSALSLLGDIRFSAPFFLPEMIAVPAGEVVMGSPEYSSDQPVHSLEVAGFSLAQSPVTNAAYAVFVNATDHRRPLDWSRGVPPESLLNAPVVWVSAVDAEQYCCWLRTETGLGFRLPSEAEWVAAARGCLDARRYPWGDDYRPGCANIWRGAESSGLCAVGMFPDGRGPYGHLDLAGNVWEWCSSAYSPYSYLQKDGGESPGEMAHFRVMHGGSWRSRKESVQCSARQGERFEVVGFRLARD